MEDCVSLLQHPSALPALAVDDREFLMRTYEQLWEGLRELPLRLSPIHGDAHLGNVFITPEGPLWTDFEAACLGPREWDISGVPYPPAFAALDQTAYAIMSDLRRLCIVVWCSALAADPGKRAAAEYHLTRLRMANQK
jgi:thiamine kinase-like enzyme